MKTIACVLLLACLFAAAPPATAKGSKAEVLQKIQALLDQGDLDQAKQMIDFFLGKNPGDADLLALADRWRVQRGDLSDLLAGEDLASPAKRELLRSAAFKIVAATMAGNPEEWDALLSVGDTDRVKALLARARDNGQPEDRQTATRLLGRLDAPEKAAEDVPPERLLVAVRSPDPKQQLWGLGRAEADKVGIVRDDAERLWKKSGDIEVKYAAAGVLLALGDPAVRKELTAALHADRPVDAVQAGKVLIRHPGPAPTALQTLVAKIEKDDAIGRARPTLLSLGLAGLAGKGEPGTREFLEARLSRPDLRVDAARALGALGDPDAVPALIRYLKSPPPAREEATAGGLGFLGSKTGGAAATAAAESIRPALVGALAILRLTRPEKPK
jgi:HEAT repeat protein